MRFHLTGTSKDSENTHLYPKSPLPKGHFCSFALQRVLSLVSLWAQETSLEANKTKCQCLFRHPVSSRSLEDEPDARGPSRTKSNWAGVAGVVWCKITPNVSQLLSMATLPPVKKVFGMCLFTLFL